MPCAVADYGWGQGHGTRAQWQQMVLKPIQLLADQSGHKDHCQEKLWCGWQVHTL